MLLGPKGKLSSGRIDYERSLKWVRQSHGLGLTFVDELGIFLTPILTGK